MDTNPETTLNENPLKDSSLEAPIDDKPQADSSPAKQDAKAEMTPLERAMSIVDASSAAKEDKGVEDKEEVVEASVKSSTTVEKKTTPTVKETVDETKQGDERYDKIPRFKELIDWRKTHEPIVQKAQQQQQWMQSYGITEPMLQETHGFLTSLMAGDFNKAYAAMKPVFEQLEKSVGVVKSPEQLPKELQDAVTAGKIDLEYATRLHQGQVAQQNTQQFTVRQQQQQAQQAGVNAINTWEQSVLKTDADWQSKRAFVDTELKALRMQYPNAGPQELVQLCQQAYINVNQRLSSFAPKPVTRTIPSANGSTKTKDAKPLHGYELAMDIVNKRFAG